MGKYVRDTELKEACGFTPGCQICYWDPNTECWMTAVADEDGKAMLPGCFCGFHREPMVPARFTRVIMCCCTCACAAAHALDTWTGRKKKVRIHVLS